MTFDFDRLIGRDEDGKLTELKNQLRLIDRYSTYNGLLQYAPGRELNFELDILAELKDAAAAPVSENTRSKLAAAEGRMRALIENKAKSAAVVEIDVGRINSEQGSKMIAAAVAAAQAKPLAEGRLDVEKELEKTTERFFCIYDQLAVLTSLRAICLAADKKDLAELVRKCESQLKTKGESEGERRTAIEQLKAVFAAARWPVGKTIKQIMTEKPPQDRPDDTGDDDAPSPKRAKIGGRRTFRRKGLPQLL